MTVRATKRGAERTPIGGDFDVLICGASFAGLAIARELRATGARRLVHGHTHRPAIHELDVDGAKAERVVLAPWYESASCVAIDAAGVREVPLPR